MNKSHHERAIQLQSQLGLRVHEVMTLTDKQVKEALNTNVIQIQGKGGQIRHLELNNQIRGVLSDSVENKLSERFLHVSEHSTVDKAINQYTDYIRNHRTKITEQKITTHSFRRYFANEQYKQALEQGMTKEQAEITVSKKLGHNRAEVTRIYLRRSEERRVGKECRERRHTRSKRDWSSDVCSSDLTQITSGTIEPRLQNKKSRLTASEDTSPTNNTNKH